VLDFGPGDSIASAILGASYGAITILIDAGDYATVDVEFYKIFAASLTGRDSKAPSLDYAKDRAEILDQCDAAYFTHGLQSLRSIPSHSVDLIGSL
jgi:hypothetical protein